MKVELEILDHDSLNNKWEIKIDGVVYIGNAHELMNAIYYEELEYYERAER